MSEAKETRSTLTRRVLILAATIALLQSLFLGYLGWMVKESYEHVEKERHARAIVGTLGRLSNLIQKLTIGVLEAVATREAVSNPSAYLREYAQVVGSFPRELKALQNLLKPYPETKKNYNELTESYYSGIDMIDKLKSNARSDATRHYFLLYKLQENSNATTEKLDNFETKFRRIEETTSAELQAHSESLLTVSLSLGIVVNVLVAAILYWFFVRAITGRLKVVADNTVNMALGKPLLEPISGEDEIAQLDRAMRALATDLEDYQSKEKTILENAANFICSVNDKGVFVEVNAASSALWGYTPDELIGRRISSLILPEQIDETVSSIEKLFVEHVPVSFENTLKRKDGEYIDLSWSAQPGEEVDSVVLIAHDITERNRLTNLIRESEEQFRTVIDNLPVAVFTLNSSFLVKSVNPMTEKMFQYKPIELFGKDISMLLTGKTSRSATETGIMKSAEHQPIELEAHRKDGSPQAVSLIVNRYTSQEKETVLAVFQDITARKEIELVKRDFISMISHDLRSPLTSLHGTLGMMAAQVNDDNSLIPTEKETLLDAERDIGKLVNLINDFLDLEKIESGTYSFETNDTDLNNLIEEAAEQIRNMAPEDRRELQIRCTDSAKVTVDSERITLAFLSFASAAMRFSPKGSKVTITTKALPTVATIFISADDCKISPEMRETCLTRYAMIDLPQDDTWNVSGLSLALARATIESHHGTLSIDTKEGCDGFLLSLPT